MEVGHYQGPYGPLGKLLGLSGNPAGACPLSLLAIWRIILQYQQVKNIFNPLYVNILDTFSSVLSKMIITSV